MTNLREMIVATLRSQGCDGLYNADAGCGGCTLDDLMPCLNKVSGMGDCKPAYESVCPCCGSTILIEARVMGR